MMGPPNLPCAQVVRAPIVCPSNRLAIGAAFVMTEPFVTRSTVNSGHDYVNSRIMLSHHASNMME